jgi:tRNA nucleotidyltransferase/poly(A) polymerase
MTIHFYEVGGCVRDSLLGLPSKDIDFVVVAPSYEAMRSHLLEQGFKVYLEKPEFVTIRCGVPADHPLRARVKDTDFVLARKDAPTGDGRRPDYVEAGTLADDLARRDFSVNAIAKCPLTGELIDHHQGVQDLQQRLLRFVGDPSKRIEEDGLRVLRGFRFMITKGLQPTKETHQALLSIEAAQRLQCVSIERVREELEKMLSHSTPDSLMLLAGLPEHTRKMIFREGLRLSPTLKQS